MASKFKKQIDNTYIRTIQINGRHYKLSVEESVWERNNVSRHVSYWIKRTQEGKSCKFKYGTVEVLNTSIRNEYKCSKCTRQYKTRYGLLRHIKKYHNITSTDTDLDNIRTEAPITNITNQTTTNNNIQINLPPLRNFNEENQNWLTHEVIMEAIRDIPTAIPYLIKEKHFNDKFPENQNLRLENKRSIRKRLKVYDGGMWRLKDRPEVEYRLIEQVYHVLFDFVEMMSEEDDEEEIDDDASPIERRIASITRRIRTSELRIARVRQSLRGWERFKDNIEGDYDKTIEPFKDKMDTFLLDNELKIEQLKERRALLLG